MENTFGTITIKNFAKLMERGTSTIYDWKNNGTLPPSCFKKVGGTWYVIIEKVKEFLVA